MEALASPQRGEQQRGEGVTLNRTVSGHPLSRREQADSHAEGQALELLWNIERSFDLTLT